MKIVNLRVIFLNPFLIYSSTRSSLFICFLSLSFVATVPALHHFSSGNFTLAVSSLVVCYSRDVLINLPRVTQKPADVGESKRCCTVMCKYYRTSGTPHHEHDTIWWPNLNCSNIFISYHWGK